MDEYQRIPKDRAVKGYQTLLAMCADRMPPLWPKPPRWPHDSVWREKLSINFPTVQKPVLEFILYAAIDQRSLEARWRHFVHLTDQ
eukprot:408197-Prorocentrum_minimum.AAC.4